MQENDTYRKTVKLISVDVARTKLDRAILSFSVITEMENAVSENASKMSSVIKSIRALEILENQIEIFTYRLSPKFEFPKKGAEIAKKYFEKRIVQISSIKLAAGLAIITVSVILTGGVSSIV